MGWGGGKLNFLGAKSRHVLLPPPQSVKARMLEVDFKKTQIETCACVGIANKFQLYYKCIHSFVGCFSIALLLFCQNLHLPEFGGQPPPLREIRKFLKNCFSLLTAPFPGICSTLDNGPRCTQSAAPAPDSRARISDHHGLKRVLCNKTHGLQHVALQYKLSFSRTGFGVNKNRFQK